MYYLSEIYSPKPSWLALSQEERFTFFATIEAGMSALAESGVEILTMSVVDKKNVFSPPQQFFALWRFPTQESLNALLEGIEATGWHNYFETINIAGEGGDITSHLNDLASL